MSQNTNKKWIIAFVILLIFNLTTAAFTGYCIVRGSGGQPEPETALSYDSAKNGMYVLYIGTNDKDTYEQIIPTEDAVEIVNNICAKHVEGYTFQHALGGWVDELGVLTQENTLVYYITYADEAAIIAIMDEVLAALNQNAILIERRDITSAFYNGGRGE